MSEGHAPELPLPPAPKGILRKAEGEDAAAAARKRRARWDEQNLKKNEEEKVPHMKIDEPDTPYNAAYDPDEVERAIAEEAAAAPSPAGHVPAKKVLDPAAVAAAALERREEEEADDGEWESDGDEAREARRAAKKEQAFRMARAAHYRIPKGLLKKGGADEDEDEEGEKEE